MAECRIKELALGNLKLLEDLVAFKQNFYPSTWARYDLARPGTFCLIPDPRLVPALTKDFREMPSCNTAKFRHSTSFLPC